MSTSNKTRKGTKPRRVTIEGRSSPETSPEVVRSLEILTIYKSILSFYDRAEFDEYGRRRDMSFQSPCGTISYGFPPVRILPLGMKVSGMEGELFHEVTTLLKDLNEVCYRPYCLEIQDLEPTVEKSYYVTRELTYYLFQESPDYDDNIMAMIPLHMPDDFDRSLVATEVPEVFGKVFKHLVKKTYSQSPESAQGQVLRFTSEMLQDIAAQAGILLYPWAPQQLLNEWGSRVIGSMSSFKKV